MPKVKLKVAVIGKGKAGDIVEVTDEALESALYKDRIEQVFYEEKPKANKSKATKTKKAMETGQKDS